MHQNKVYSATLNQSNIQNNNNKYYIVQILQNDSNSNKTYFFTKWGRIGKVAGTASEGPYTRDQAIVCYRNKYREKTKSGKYIEI